MEIKVSQPLVLVVICFRSLGWNKEWASLAMDLAQDRRTWSAAVRGAVNAMDADSARAG